MVYLSQSNLCLMVSPGLTPIRHIPHIDVGARDHR